MAFAQPLWPSAGLAISAISETWQTVVFRIQQKYLHSSPVFILIYLSPVNIIKTVHNRSNGNSSREETLLSIRIWNLKRKIRQERTNICQSLWIWIYNEKPIDKTLQFEFQKDGKTCSSFLSDWTFTDGVQPGSLTKETWKALRKKVWTKYGSQLPMWLGRFTSTICSPLPKWIIATRQRLAGSIREQRDR